MSKKIIHPTHESTPADFKRAAQTARTLLAIMFGGVFAAGYAFKADIEALNLEPMFLAVLLTTLLMLIMLPKALVQNSVEEKARWIKRMAMLDGAIIWGCMLYYVFQNIL